MKKVIESYTCDKCGKDCPAELYRSELDSFEDDDELNKRFESTFYYIASCPGAWKEHETHLAFPENPTVHHFCSRECCESFDKEHRANGPYFSYEDLGRAVVKDATMLASVMRTLMRGWPISKKRKDVMKPEEL